MRILIRQGGFINKGAEAMVRTVQAELGSRLPNSEFALPPEVLTRGTIPMAEAAGLEIPPKNRRTRDRLVRLGCHIACNPFRARRGIFSRTGMYFMGIVEGFHAIVDVAGFAYADVWGVKKAEEAACCVAAARCFDQPYIFLPQAWGPFSSDSHRSVCSRMLNLAQGFYARDNVSRQHLADLLGAESSSIPQSPDIAFRFQGAPADIGRALVESETRLPDSGFVAAVAPNCRVYERTRGSGLRNTYVRTLCEICSELRQAGAGVVLIPHEINAKEMGSFDDRLLCSLIAGEVRDPGVVALTGQYTAEELKGVIAGCRLLVGSRFHALVAALSQGIPVAALGWSHKYFELLNGFGLSEFVFPHESLDPGLIRNGVRRFVHEHEALGCALQPALAGILKRVDSVFDETARAILGEMRLQVA